MAEFSFLMSLIKDAPLYFVLTIGFTVALFSLYLKVRSVNVAEMTSVSKIQTEQVGQLLAQIKALSEDLTAARTQIREMYEKVGELEDLVRHYKSKCDSCPFVPPK